MTSNNIYQEKQLPSQRERFLSSFRANGLAMFGFWCLTIILIISIFAPWITPHDPLAQSNHLLQPPSWDKQGNIEYFLGTDDLGRDILSRLIAGSRITFVGAFGITFISALIGCTIGAFAGMTKGLLSSVLNHLLDTIMSIPSLLLAIIFVTFYGQSIHSAMFAIAIALMPRFIRSAYNAVHNEIDKDYITAARLDGASRFYLFWNSIRPNIMPVMVIEYSMALAVAIIEITTLGFLGLGAQAPSPEWGTIIGASIELVYLAPWTIILPGLAITTTVISVALVGEGVSDALNSGVE